MLGVYDCVRLGSLILCVFYAMSYVFFLGGIKRKVLCDDLFGVVHYGSGHTGGGDI